MMLKNIIIILFIFNSLTACAMGAKPPRPHKLPERKMQDKLFRPCQDFEVANPVGKFCNRVCVKRSGLDCKKWKTNVKDFTDPETFKFFRSSSFILIDEDEAL